MNSTTTPTPPAPDEKPVRSDATNWSKPIVTLDVKEEHVPAGAINLNVEGRRISNPIQGFGRMWRKLHRIRLEGAAVTPAEVIKTWKERFGEFWPKGNRFYGPLTGIAPGEVALLNSTIPGGKISTGVLVVYADDESFTLMPSQGHVFAGMITFSAHIEDGTTVAQVEILMRANDPVFEIGMVMVGHRIENRLWEQTLANLAAHFGVTATATTQVECVDRRYQWGRVVNIWHNAAIRTGLYVFSSPIRGLGRRLRRRFAAGGQPPGDPSLSQGR
jgi:hypothetical protein